MTLTDLAALGGFISGIAVPVSLIYLAIQTHQSIRQSRALIQQGRAQRTFELLIRWGEFDWTEGMLKCANGSPDVSATDVRRFVSLMRAFFVNYEDSFLQHREGLLPDTMFANVEAAFRSAMTNPGHRVAWQTVRRFFGSDFQVYVDRLIAEAPMNTGTTGLLAQWQAAANALPR